MGDCDHDGSGEGACGDEAAELGSEGPQVATAEGGAPGAHPGRGEALDAAEAGEGAACEGALDASAPGRGNSAVGGEGDGGDGLEAAADDVADVADSPRRLLEDLDAEVGVAIAGVQVEARNRLVGKLVGPPEQHQPPLVDSYSRYCKNHAACRKSDALVLFKQAVIEFTRKAGRPVQSVQADNDAVFTAGDFTEFCVHTVIALQFIRPGVPKYNGVAESAIWRAMKAGKA
eukprot:g8919.t1